MPTASPTPCPECGAPPAAPFARDPTMRRARRTARLILLLAIITPLLAASILWPGSSTTPQSLFPSTFEPQRPLLLEAMKTIADGSRPASDLLNHVRRLGDSTTLSTDAIKLLVFRQREKTDEERSRHFGVPLPTAEWFTWARLGTPNPAGPLGGCWSYAWLDVHNHQFSIWFGPMALYICGCLVLFHALRMLKFKRWSLPVAVVVFGCLALWPQQSDRTTYKAIVSVIPSWAIGGTPDKQGFPYPRTDAEARAIAAEVVNVTERVGTTPLDGDFVILAEISGARPTHTLYAHPFPILQHTTLTSTTPFPPHRTAARLSWHSFDLQLPNTATATTRHILSLDIPALAQLILLFILTYHTIRLIHYRILKHRHHNRLHQNLCPMCAYPAPKPA